MTLKKMLAFMDEDDIREIAREILKDNPDYEEIPLMELLPFMDEDDVDDIALQIYHKEGYVSGILPFVSEETAARLAREVIENEENPDISAILPFMDEDDVGDVARKMIAEGRGFTDKLLSKMLPFMDEDDVDDIAVDLYRQGGKIHDILPFVSEEGAGKLARIVVELEENPDIVAIMPFMDDDDIDEVFCYLARMEKTSEAMYPFVSDDGWHKVLKGYLNGEYEFDFDGAYPFMDDDDIRELFRYEMKKHRD
ncbi:MAG: hypothetical protein IJG49_03855 [Erysipelotrichaceae bacterium]|nr:hypothetical protein [Erysipelotrichaceae bacterium]